MRLSYRIHSLSEEFMTSCFIRKFERCLKYELIKATKTTVEEMGLDRIEEAKEVQRKFQQGGSSQLALPTTSSTVLNNA